MERIELTKKGKQIMWALQANNYPSSVPSEDTNDVTVLIEDGLIKATTIMDGSYCAASLTQKGKAYLHCNPKLKNPSIWEDKKYWITTAIAIIALANSFIALFQSCQ